MYIDEVSLFYFKIRKRVVLIACAFAIIFINDAFSRGVDKTREPNTSGEDVVKATISLIQNSDIFRNDNGFLRRLAYVESKDGTHPTTYRDEYHGGIWQIDEDVFKTITLQAPYGMHQNISAKFKIIWSGVDWSDLRKPLFSAIAASMYLSLRNERVPPLFAIESQAEFWSDHFGISTTRNKEEFISAVEDLKSEGCTTAKLDIAFVVDGSGSVGKEQFNVARNFVSDIVDNFDIGPDRVRVGFIQFEGHPEVEIGMNEYTDKFSLMHTIRRIEHMSGGTHTGDAINLMVTQLYGDGNGARHPDEKVPRVGIIMTDGKSHDDVFWPAEAARNAGIKLYAIGIGEEINDTQLRQIANDPAEHYVVHVNDYSVVDNIRYEISQDTCEEPILPDMGKKLNNTLNTASKVYFESEFPSSGKLTFTLTASSGKATAYLSTEIRNPNEAFHQWSVEASDETPSAQVYIDNSTPEARKRRQVPADDQLQLYGTVINTYEDSKADGVTSQPNVETVFSVLIEEGDTRIYVPTTESGVTTILHSEPSDSGISVGIIVGIAVAGTFAILAITALLACILIKRHREKEPDPSLIRQRGESTASTMAAEMARYDDEPISMPYRVGSNMPTENEPPSKVGFSYFGNENQAYVNCQMGTTVPAKPGHNDEPIPNNDNTYTTEPHQDSNRESIYEINEIN